MKIYHKVDQFTINRIKAEGKIRVDKSIIPIGPVIAPVMFNNPNIPPNSFFGVDEGKLTMRDNDQKIDFGFKLYTTSDGPYVIPEMIQSFNSFIDSFYEVGLVIRDDSVFPCVDKLLFNLGYIGKMILVQEAEVKENGDKYAISYRYAESLITKDDYEYQEYEWSKIIPEQI